MRELHRLVLEGKADDSPEADAIRDATDEPWRVLSETGSATRPRAIAPAQLSYLRGVIW